ncbi:hypothetical protein [Desulfogranum marinum]|uniref:hypothetical protein n=1 Tax=Desulfogranum marinum TaxID=453220 RepID=UPI0029C791A9|nr:hypothetical protein [Desulfogranum marinum]
MCAKPTYEELEKKIQELEKAESARIENEETINENQDLFSVLFEYMPSGVAIYKPTDNGSDFVFKSLNREAEIVTQISRNDAIGHRLLELFPNMNKTSLFRALQRVCKTGIKEHIPPFYYKDEVRKGWFENIVFRLPSNDVVAIFNVITTNLQLDLERAD